MMRGIGKGYESGITVEQIEPDDTTYNQDLLPLDDPALKSANIIHEDSSKVSMLFPIPYSYPLINHDQLFKSLQKGIETNFKEMEVVIIGRIPLEIEPFASKAPMGAIRWWLMERSDSLETCIQYAKTVTFIN